MYKLRYYYAHFRCRQCDKSEASHAASVVTRAVTMARATHDTAGWHIWVAKSRASFVGGLRDAVSGRFCLVLCTPRVTRGHVHELVVTSRIVRKVTLGGALLVASQRQPRLSPAHCGPADSDHDVLGLGHHDVPVNSHCELRDSKRMSVRDSPDACGDGD